ncbi:hypothetical protein [Deinococcus multiflagellatus]|uniref:Uncharacterized protein n=1 Tax=Deinococcus multiflagellatus TaxID=1656887 RepID=A0ABW1ZI98_9DEIO|nr:hypothetical protein [Deinococcus multiflagellatus]MBZ9713710.1 hypothetical protein [Deinococcus multiflagellatus]
MRKRILLGMLVVSTAQAANRDPANLKNLNTCFDKASVQVGQSVGVEAAAISEAVFQKVSTKLRAYRVPFTTNCDLSRTRVYVQIDAFKTSLGVLAYSFAVDIYDQLTFPGVVSIWNAGSFGVTGRTGTALTNDFADDVGSTIDQLAADYATANP